MLVPEVLARELARRGLGPEFVADVLIAALGLDPRDAARAHAELALGMYKEGLAYVERGDVVQASEKLYKAVEEGVKALALSRGLPEAEEAASKGRWTVALLDKAADKLGDVVYRAWDAAYFLHVNGFHEVRIDIDIVRAKLKAIEPMMELVKELAGRGSP